jgi:hypothetical protein
MNQEEPNEHWAALQNDLFGQGYRTDINKQFQKKKTSKTVTTIPLIL